MLIWAAVRVCVAYVSVHVCMLSTEMPNLLCYCKFDYVKKIGVWGMPTAKGPLNDVPYRDDKSAKQASSNHILQCVPVDLKCSIIGLN